MKPLLFYTFFLMLTVFVTLPVYADLSEESALIYNEANDFYSSKEYNTALNSYTELIERGIKNPSLFYNLGNTYFKLGQIGYAILYYEKALSLKPFDRDIRNNLEYARRSMEERIQPLYNEGLFNFLRTTYSFVKPWLLTVFELVFFTGFIVFSILFILFPYHRQRFRKQVIVFGILFFVFGMCAFSRTAYENANPKGIVVEEAVEVLSAPIVESEPVFQLYEGTRTKVLETRGDWIRIRIDDGREGWILQQDIALI
jgi:tetratricopeptide (TPR) repeat protein